MNILYAKSGPEWTTLKDHLTHVAIASKAFAKYLDMDESLAFNGAILHDIGKAHPVFQQRLLGKSNSRKVFRHEIASLFFLSAFPENEHPALIEMVVGHHKSVKNDVGNKGLLDLDDKGDLNYIDYHLGNWEEWFPEASEILNSFGFTIEYISKEVAIKNIEYVINYTANEALEKGYSEWRGLLMGADHFASAIINRTQKKIDRAFKNPNLSFFDRTDDLYPLSKKQDYLSTKKHTIVVACTGAGKTDYLFKRCKNERVFYTLPFQASINAMYKRVKNDLKSTNPDLDIRVLHAASMIVSEKNGEDESVLQSLFGSSIKILTPHQLAAITFGMKGFEALLLDLRGCNIILDEVHTYSGVSQAIVLKLVQILNFIDCKIHIGTATMSTILYNKIIDLLGEDILKVTLTEEEQDKFNRHRTIKIDSFEKGQEIICSSIEKNEKILIVLNTVENAQNVFKTLSETYSDIPILLLHSRFKRGDRNQKERRLLGLDELRKPTGEFNTSESACIVVSTQIVEVSLDISFDVMITESAPIDALIQRFGRINRKRTPENEGTIKDVYVIAPPENLPDNKPYNLEILQRSFEILPHNEILQERYLQEKIDFVFPEINFLEIEEHSVFKTGGRITIEKLTHNKSILLKLLDIDSVACICEEDEQLYMTSNFKERLDLEIPVRYFSVCKMKQLKDYGNKPYVIPNSAYDFEKGLDLKKIKNENLDSKYQFL
ncbi:MAG: hypothetical protein RLZZ306_1590 [Bacteroidota bacterium]|jgi:CRISPR-associated endonuclease/helicase Cas3